MLTTGRYVYGFIRTQAPLDWGRIGLEHEGGPGRVFTVAVDGFAAVVSEFSARGKVMPLRKNLEPHHRVVREISRTVTILPMAFGHVARSEQEIAKTLRRNRDEMARVFERIDGKVEMGLKVKWDVDNIFEYVLGLDAELAAFRDELFGGSHAPTAAQKIELGRMFERRLTQEREELVERVVEAFKPYCAEHKLNAPKTEKIAIDLAFLVERDAVKAFEERIYHVAGAFAAHYVFDLAGPWAPFDFADLDLDAATA